MEDSWIEPGATDDDRHDRRRHLRLVASNAEPRICAQSTSPRSSSHVTRPADSRSISIASDSPQGRKPYAILRRCPGVVPHLSAKDLRSTTGNCFKNALNSMPPLYQTVTQKQAPNSAFTKWCMNGDNRGVKNEDQAIRAENLKRLIEMQFRGNASRLARACGKKPNYLSALKNGKKSFAEKAARSIEWGAGLIRGQLDIPNSLLLRDPNRRERPRDEVQAVIDDMGEEALRDALPLLRKLQARERLKATG